MSTRPASPAPASDALRLQMERSIDELAVLARSEAEPGRFFAEVLRKALQPGGSSHVVLWRASLEGRWEPVAEMPPSGGLTSDKVAERQELLNEVADDRQPRVIPETSTQSQVLSPLRHSGATVGILETVHPVPASGNLSQVTFQFFAALSEITADFLSQQELQQLLRARSLWQQWDQYQLRLGKSLELAAVCATVANDGRIIAGVDRIAVLIRHGRSYRVHAITGVERPDPRAGGVQSLEIFVSQIPNKAWMTWSDQNTAIKPAAESQIERYCRESGAMQIGVVPAGLGLGDSPAAMIVFENFRHDEGWSDRQAIATALEQRSSLALSAAIELSEVPWLWQRVRRQSWLRRPGLLFAMIALAVIATILVVVPGEFTVSGNAELWPELRRHVFASTTGVVDKILVNHGDQVESDQPLVVLRDPDLEQDVPRIAGEIATAQERLRGLQIARFSAATTPENAARIRQLTAEEEELKERLKTLNRQQSLVEERREKLTLRSPIAGQVLTWDTHQHLSARPVERGQALLTIGETGGSWIVEIQVADKDVGHMRRAQKASGEDLRVEFQLPSDPGRTYVGKIRNVSLASESDDRSHGHVRVIVEFDRSQIEQLRPGVTAVPRIQCGRQPLGYIWLHDLIDAIRLRLLF